MKNIEIEKWQKLLAARGSGVKVDQKRAVEVLKKVDESIELTDKAKELLLVFQMGKILYDCASLGADEAFTGIQEGQEQDYYDVICQLKTIINDIAESQS